MALIICSKFVTEKLIEGKTVQFLPAQKKKKKTKQNKNKKTKIPATSLLFVEEHNCDTQLMGYINTKINVIRNSNWEYVSVISFFYLFMKVTVIS